LVSKKKVVKKKNSSTKNTSIKSSDKMPGPISNSPLVQVAVMPTIDPKFKTGTI